MKINSFFINVLIFFFIYGCNRPYDPIQPGSNHVMHLQAKSSQASTLALYSVPAGYDPDKAWPLIVVMHGYGDEAAAFHDLWKPVTDSMGFVLLSPQGEKRVDGAGWSWGRESEPFIKNFIDEVRMKVNIDPKRIYVGGFSAGGNLAYYLGLKYPQVFAGIVALGAPFNRDVMQVVRVPQLLQNTRVYIGHGTLENNFESDAKLAEAEFKKLGVRTRFAAYQNTGHALPDPKRDEIISILKFLVE